LRLRWYGYDFRLFVTYDRSNLFEERSMPVTAKLSRKVYDRLGDEVVNAIVDWFNQVDATYRADLREMNDLNFARFDAKMGERLAELDAKWERRFGAFETKIERRLGELQGELTRRMYGASLATFLAQIVALVTLLKFFNTR
jgi:hypothetical protein